MMASRQGVESKISRRNEKLISKRQIYSGKRTKDQITQIRSQQAGLGGEAGGVPYLCWMSGDKTTLKSTETRAKTQKKRFDSPQNAGVYVKSDSEQWIFTKWNFRTSRAQGAKGTANLWSVKFGGNMG